MNIKDPDFNPNKVVDDFLRTGEMKTDDAVNSVLSISRGMLHSSLEEVQTGFGLATQLIESRPDKVACLKNGTWIDLIDHLTAIYKFTSSLELLENRMSTDQVWFQYDGSPLIMEGGMLWDSDQADSLPTGTVIRFRDQERVVVASKDRDGKWCEGSAPLPQVIYPAVILAGPMNEEEHEYLSQTAEIRKGILEEDE